MNGTTLGLGILVLLHLGTPLDERPVVFAPEEGTTLEKRFQWTTRAKTEEFALDLGGQVFDQGLGLERDVDHVLVVEDTYAAVADGRPADLVRVYRQVGRETEAFTPEGDGTVHVAGLGPYSSVLQGHHVRFRWDADREAYEREWAEGDPGDGEEEWLAPLAEDLDLRVFLPAEAVAEGATWDVGTEALNALLSPGGDLRLEPPREAPDGEGLSIHVPSVRIADHLEDLDGRITCQLLAFEERDGLRHALIQVDVDVSQERDLAQAMAERDPDAQVYDVVERSLSLLGKGTLRWDLDRDHFVSLEFEAEVEQSLEAEWASPAMGDEIVLLLTSSERGTVECRFGLE